MNKDKLNDTIIMHHTNLKILTDTFLYLLTCFKFMYLFTLALKPVQYAQLNSSPFFCELVCLSGQDISEKRKVAYRDASKHIRCHQIDCHKRIHKEPFKCLFGPDVGIYCKIKQTSCI